MNTFFRVILSGLPIIITVIVAGYIYRLIPTTPVFILLLLLVFAAVFSTFILYQKLKISHPDIDELVVDYIPDLEDGLIYAVPSDFSAKAEPQQGFLFVVGTSLEEEKTQLKKATYLKLTNTTQLEFEGNLLIEIDDLNSIGIGDGQFAFFGFAVLRIMKGKKLLHTLKWTDNHLALIQEEETKRILLPDGSPTVVFTWEREDDTL